MGVIIKYLLDFPELGFKVSNDVFQAKFTLDTSIKIEMTVGIPGCSFEIQMLDLPASSAESIFNALHLQKNEPTSLVHVKVKLGYFDGPFEPVMEGIIQQVRNIVQDDKLVTIIKGLETGTRALNVTPYSGTLEPPIQVDQAIIKILDDTTLIGGEFTKPPQLDNNLTASLGTRTPRGPHVIDAIGDLAKVAEADLLICDKKLWVGKPVLVDYPGNQPPKFVPAINLGTFEPFSDHIPDENDSRLAKPSKATDVKGFSFSVTGDPKLRPGHQVTLDNGLLKDPGEFRVYAVTHKLSMTEGYTCTGKAVKVGTDANHHRVALTAELPSADSLVEGVTQIATASRKQRPSIEIGKVKSYSPGSASEKNNTSVLYYGQVFERTESQPSINTDVMDTNDNQLANDKPIVSLFAWHKCGLVVPVWKGMKAVLSHNLSLEDDAMVSGFIWSKRPVIEPPQNKAGDWWLCLPVFADDYDGSSPPSDSTKAANDLVGKSGKRVIEAKGLKITVGADKLGTVGSRPTEGDDDVFLIEHKSGTTFQIAADGALAISASKLSIKGDVTIEGNVEIK